MRLLAMTAALAVSAGLAAPALGASKTLALGFSDPMFLQGTVAAPWFSRVSESGGTIVRLDPHWATIAPTRPTSPTSPSDSAYRWTALDTAVKQATAAGLTVAIMVEIAPRWAEGPERAADARNGTWDPDPEAFGAFAQALASRYDGTFPDPAGTGSALPAVRYFQGWNEPNLDYHFAPQWIRSQGRWKLASPTRYRHLLNSFYAGIKRAQPDAQVLAAGTAPYGDLVEGGERLQPARFWRAVFCYSTRTLRRTKCDSPARFDIFDHHPYSVGGPYRKALNADDVSVPDLGKLTEPLRAAERRGTALPKKRHPFWVTEVSWDSAPPDPDGVPERRWNRWIAQTFEQLWRQGVQTVLWYSIRDAAPTPSYAATYQSGMYFNDGTAKSGQKTFRLPVVVRRAGKRSIVWSRSPSPGHIQIDRRIGGSWTRIADVQVSAGQVVERSFATSGGTRFRVRLDPAL